MKRLFFFLNMILCVACKISTQYEIKGIISDSSLNGQYVYLQQIKDNQLVDLDSALVKQERFEFLGNEKSTVIREINFKRNSKNKFSPLIFILEKGFYQAYIDTFSYMDGSDANNKLKDYFWQLQYYKRKISQLVNQYNQTIKDTPSTDSILIAYQGQFDTYRDDINTLSYDFSLINNNSVAGALVFLQSYNIFSLTQALTILSDAGPIFLNVPGIKYVEEYTRSKRLVALGRPFFNFTLPDINGKMVEFKSLFKGMNYVLLNFNASWCVPCIENMKLLKEKYEEYHNKGITFVSVSLDTEKSAWINTLQAYPQPWIQLSDLKGWNSNPASLYGIRVLPYMILFDPKGFIIARGVHLETIFKKYNLVKQSVNNKSNQ